MTITRAKIRDAEDRFPGQGSGAMAYVRELWPKFQGGRPVPTGFAIGKAITPFVSHGRWVIVCPDPECGSGQYASRADKRFLCVECANHHAGELWIEVRWPDEADEIEALLGARPNHKLRTWLPTETLDDLRAQNEKMGAR